MSLPHWCFGWLCHGCLGFWLRRYRGVLVLPPCTLCSCFGVCPVAFRFLQILLPFVLCFLLVLLYLPNFGRRVRHLAKCMLMMCCVLTAVILSFMGVGIQPCCCSRRGGVNVPLCSAEFLGSGLFLSVGLCISALSAPVFQAPRAVGGFSPSDK